MSLTEKILKGKKMDVTGFELIPGDGGKFELEIDGKLVFSKKAEGRFPEWAEIQAHLG